jgi:prepilin-type N-terminal cleavage/methylation domain-containing protein
MLKKFKIGLTGSRGDTIVEVMVVLAVLGLAIGISYATANRSLLDARQAQENAQATELAQSQIESLRTLTPAADTAIPTKDIFQTGLLYCINGNYNVATGNSCNQGSIPYNMAVTYVAASPPAPLPGGTFTITVTWPDVEGQGNDTVTLVYRLYQSP